MRIMGVDPALVVTGWGVIDIANDTPVHVASGIIKTSSADPIAVRLEAIHSGITSRINEYAAQVMVLEKVFVHHRHTTTAFALGQARGSIVLAAQKCSIPLAEYAATQVKKSITGRGHATKEQIRRMVVSLLGMKEIPSYYDVTDALAMALAYGSFNRNAAISRLLASGRR